MTSRCRKTAKTIRVPVVDDDVDEKETFTLTPGEPFDGVEQLDEAFPLAGGQADPSPLPQRRSR